MRNKLLEAVVFAAEAHKHQKRRGKQGSYICHPLRVCAALSAAGAPEVAVIAGVLHDTVEDTEVTIAEIETLFDLGVDLIITDEPDVFEALLAERCSDFTPDPECDPTEGDDDDSAGDDDDSCADCSSSVAGRPATLPYLALGVLFAARRRR